MGRHAKNNCANPVFTYEERRKLTGWGTQKQRLGSDSMLPYENCAVCLHEAQEPLCCPKGHIFCKGCIYENLLAQKQHAKEQAKAYEQQLQQAEDEKKLAEEQEHQKRLEKFDRSESSVLPTDSEIQLAKRVQSESQVPAGYVAVKTGTGTLYRKELTAEEITKYKQLPCYWIPSLAPSNVKEKVQKPTDICLCPVKPHPLKAKQLFAVKFTATQAKDREKAESKEAKNMCPSCRKSLTNSTKMSVLQRCGHVFCRTCADTLIKKDKECVVCTKECGADEIIPLDVGGTGFASAGGAMAESRVTPAFQSF